MKKAPGIMLWLVVFSAVGHAAEEDAESLPTPQAPDLKGHPLAEWEKNDELELDFEVPQERFGDDTIPVVPLTVVLKNTGRVQFVAESCDAWQTTWATFDKGHIRCGREWLHVALRGHYVPCFYVLLEAQTPAKEILSNCWGSGDKSQTACVKYPGEVVADAGQTRTFQSFLQFRTGAYRNSKEGRYPNDIPFNGDNVYFATVFFLHDMNDQGGGRYAQSPTRRIVIARNAKENKVRPRSAIQLELKLNASKAAESGAAPVEIKMGNRGDRDVALHPRPYLWELKTGDSEKVEETVKNVNRREVGVACNYHVVLMVQPTRLAIEVDGDTTREERRKKCSIEPLLVKAGSEVILSCELSEGFDGWENHARFSARLGEYRLYALAIPGPWDENNFFSKVYNISEDVEPFVVSVPRNLVVENDGKK